MDTCHQIETALAAEGRAPNVDETETVVGAWNSTTSRLDIVLGRRDAILVEKTEIQALIASAESGCPSEELAVALKHWTREALARRFGRIAEQARRLAGRLDKGPVTVRVQDHGLAIAPKVLSRFWCAFTHVGRNAIDHGLETPEERSAAGKDAAQLTLAAHHAGDTFVISLSDNGRGIAWERVETKARAAGLPHATHADLVDALFSDGVSTAEAVTEVSGRGVGMAVLKATTADLGGHITVDSTKGEGTTFAFHFPAAELGLSRRSAKAPADTRATTLPARPLPAAAR